MDGCGFALCALGIEGGRTVLASAFGGLTRWVASDRRRMRDAAVAVGGGAVSGHYLWPMILWALGMEESPQSIAMAAYVAGTLGMSGVRTFAAVFEARARKLQDA